MELVRRQEKREKSDKGRARRKIALCVSVSLRNVIM
jgi:hypothetical protein